MLEILCEQCGATMLRTPASIANSAHHFCSRQCSGKWHRGAKHRLYGKHPSQESRDKMSASTRGENHPNFGKHLPAEQRRKIGDANRGKRRTEEMKRQTSEARRGKCVGEANHNFGKHLSEETRRKLSAANRGKHPSEETKRKISKALTGIVRSPETRRRMSEAQRGKPVGPNSPRWKGGNALYGFLWPQQRDVARSRDNYTCQMCGKTRDELGQRPDVHHICPVRESCDNSLENLICLCPSCHGHCEQHPQDCPVPRKHWLLPSATEWELNAEVEF